VFSRRRGLFAGWTQLQVMAARLLGELPAGETEIATTNVMPVVTNDGTVE
jgi:hypothetical protein